MGPTVLKIVKKVLLSLYPQAMTPFTSIYNSNGDLTVRGRLNSFTNFPVLYG